MQGEIEAQIKDLVHRDSMFARKSRSHPVDREATQANQLIERISAASLATIDEALSQLQRMKSSLIEQNEKLRRELRALEFATEEAAGHLKEVANILEEWRQKNCDATKSHPAE